MASPINQNVDEISPLVEVQASVNKEDPKHRWTLVPDGSGKMHLVDLNPYEVEIAPMFNADNDVFFLLFTPRNPTVGQRITFNVNGIRNSQFNSGAPTRFIIHGWNNDNDSPVNRLITAAYLRRGEFNVVSISE